ncbi:MAG: AAA family ATPase [Candidatus Bathyarchaeota archaeon]|nr:AAA family ATPase [Candidatus Bathyarchaeota archaeon]
MCVDLISRVLTGCSCLDAKLDGAIAPETVTLIYGEPETGKSTLALQCAVNCALQGYKTLFVDCDNTFSTERLMHLAQDSFNDVAQSIILMKPADFAEQTAVIDTLPDCISQNFGLVIFDTFNSLYRAKMCDVSTRASFGVNRELNRQLAVIAETAKTQHIPIIITSQVTSVFKKTHVSIAPVATRVLQFWANNTIALKPTENPTVIKASVEKNRKPQEPTCYLTITNAGINDCQTPNRR